MNVLIITHSQDNESVDMVREAIHAKGGRAWRFDTDLYPTEVSLSLGAGPEGLDYRLRTAEGELDLGTVESLWYRRVATGDGLPSLPPQFRSASLKEIHATVNGFFHAFEGFQLDGPEKVRRADHKQHQLQVARRVGLEIPATLSTNDPAAARAFFEAWGGEVVAKMLSSFAIYDEQRREQVVFTNRLRAEDLDAMEDLRLCPMTFQALVPKALELRVTIIGERVFAAAIDSQSAERAEIDWRRDGQALVSRWRAFDLPGDVEAAVLRYMDAFGMNYGAMDLILTPDGRYVFLECNPAGEFFWLQQLAPHFPLADALADVLLGRVKRRGLPRWELLGSAEPVRA